VAYGDNTAVVATNSRSIIAVPRAATFSVMYITAEAALTIDDVTYTLQLNGVDTGIAATLLHNTTAANFTGGSVTVAPGDKLSMKVVSTGTQNTAGIFNRISIA
jgi:hypothetical protein